MSGSPRDRWYDRRRRWPRYRARAQAEMAEERRLEIEREERELDARRERIEAAMRRDDERARDFANIRRRRRKAVGLY